MNHPTAPSTISMHFGLKDPENQNAFSFPGEALAFGLLLTSLRIVARWHNSNLIAHCCAAARDKQNETLTLCMFLRYWQNYESVA
jgi:hypothetical protein